MGQYENTILILAALIIVFLVIAAIHKAIKFALLAAAVLIIISILFTLVFGDGRAIVHTFASFLNEDIGQKIEQGYEYYKSREEQEQYLNVDKIAEYPAKIIRKYK